MAGSPWILFPLLALPVALGLGLLRIVGVRAREDWLFALGAAYGIGQLAIAAVLAAFVGLGLPLARGPVLGCLAVLLAAVALLAARVRPADAAPRRPCSMLERLVLGASLALCALSILVEAVDGSRFAITVADEATHYYAKSCEIFGLGRFGADYARALHEGGVAAPEYPLLDPLLMVFAHVCNGGLARVDARLPVQAFLLATALALSGSLSRWARPGLAAVLVPLALLTRTVSGLAQGASADGLVALGLLLATDGTLARYRGDTTRAAPLLALGLAIAITAKSEGTMLALLVMLANLPALWRAPDRARAWTWLSLPIAIGVAQSVFNRWHGFAYHLLADHGKGNLAERFVRQLPTNAPEVARTFVRELVYPATCTNGLLAALLLLAALAPRALRAAGTLWPALALLAAVPVHAVLMIGTGTDLAWSLQTATPRLWMQLAPAAALLVGAALPALSSQAQSMNSSGLTLKRAASLRR